MGEKKDRQRGLIIVYTGKGKGKTTAALGTMLRAWGQDMRLCMIQFIKSEKGKWGEVKAAQRLGLEWHTLGEGFTWESEDMERDIRKAREGWSLAQNKIVSGTYDLIVLDEFTYPLKYGWLDTCKVIEWLDAHRPAGLHLVITGRDAPSELVAFADLVTEMRKVKHPFDKGVPAQRGIEF
ncbi:MAG: cob(I)yrinic acid a,c-diamide adenosyltransferase [Anaerolineae bacterium]